jgi:multiple sugar transport system substrate-binding protein
MSTWTKRTAAVLPAVLALGLLTACGSDDDAAADGKVTLEVAIDQGLEQGAIDAFEARVAQFEKDNPDVVVKSKEYTWTGTTFAAELAGGTLPDVFPIPFTDGRGLIERKQIANISTLVDELPYADEFNPNVAQAGEDADGAMWAVPIAAYGQGLHYNRTLFEQAGLDPDAPPTTWDEVREDAKAIAEATDDPVQHRRLDPHLAHLRQRRQGRVCRGRHRHGDHRHPGGQGGARVPQGAALGRQLDGGQLPLRLGHHQPGLRRRQDRHVRVGRRQLRQPLHAERPEPDDYGVTVVPLEGDDAGVLGGGTLAAVSAKASPEEQAAAVKWIDFYYMQKLTDKDSAVLDAQTTADQGQPVGAPQLPVFDKATYDESQTWIADLVNVPLDQMTPYTDGIFDQPLLPEPARSTQELYAALDPVVQAVLTDENADIDSLLASAQTTVQSILDKG